VNPRMPNKLIAFYVWWFEISGPVLLLPDAKRCACGCSKPMNLVRRSKLSQWKRKCPI
jgi:hypothetical protein